MTQTDIIANALANADAETQGQVLNDWCAVLKALCRPNGGLGMQTCYIGKFLRAETAEFLGELQQAYMAHMESERSERSRIDELHRESASLTEQILRKREELNR